MRINRFLALATGVSRRAADDFVLNKKVTINGKIATIGDDVTDTDVVELLGKKISLLNKKVTIMLNKPAGFVCSRNGQGAKTVYDLLSKKYHNLKPIGRLDKDSSGLLLLTNDGELANQLTHPSFQKEKVYEITIDKALADTDQHKIEHGIKLTDGISKFKLAGAGRQWTVTMQEGRNRQIRRTFEAIGYTVTRLHRTKVANFALRDLNSGETKPIQ